MHDINFEREYAAMSDDQLRQVLADRKDLVPAAVTALDAEVQKRRLELAPPLPRWVPDPDREDAVGCLDDVPGYRNLERWKTFLDRFWYGIAFVPVLLVMSSAKYAYRDPENLRMSIAWVILTIGYWFFLKLRISAYSCPKCAQRFGPARNCSFCGFPRGSVAESSATRAG